METHNNTIKNYPKDLASELFKIKKTHFFFRIALHFFCSFLYALSISLLWYKINPESIMSSLVIGFVCFLLFVLLSTLNKIKAPEENSLLFTLDRKFPDLKTSIYDRKIWDTEAFQRDWKDKLEDLFSETKISEKKQTLSQLGVLIPAIVISCSMWAWNGSYLYESSIALFKSFSQSEATLRIIQGGINPNDISMLPLKANKTLNVTLSQLNLVEVEFIPTSSDFIPSIELKKNSPSGELLQSFQMIQTQNMGTSKFNIQFSVAESSSLFIPQFSGSFPLASFSVEEAAGPKISLKSQYPLPEQVDDDKPLELVIKAESKIPLHSINLLIRVNGRRIREPIYAINESDTYTLETQQSLALEKYIDQDFAKIEIVAEATDQSTPTALVGFSKPLIIQTISTYGKYRKTLSSLRSLKEKLDSAISQSRSTVDKYSDSEMENIQKETNESPFFDGRDRHRVEKMREGLKQNEKQPDLKSVYKISQDLSRFLQEHEMLDDRERDRDFFVAARGLSHLMEENSVSTKLAEEKMLGFLSEREKRWKVRVDRLSHPEHLKRSQNVLKDRHFTKQVENMIAKNVPENTNRNKDALRNLTEMASYYRQWINELEAEEDKDQSELDKERKNGLSSAEDDLKTLQRRQLEISRTLHNSEAQSQEDLKTRWPVARMHQNANIQDAKKLEDKLSALSSRSAERLSAAKEAMNLTEQNGELSDFSQAESFSDLAGRLLHEASNMTKEEQQMKRQAYRSGSDKYYGQTVVGGDVEIEHEYRVDPRYREDVLDEVLKSDYQGDNRTLLDNFLKRIIR